MHARMHMPRYAWTKCTAMCMGMHSVQPYMDAHADEFVRFWLHNGFVNVDSEKMSKSLGNFFTIREV